MNLIIDILFSSSFTCFIFSNSFAVLIVSVTPFTALAIFPIVETPELIKSLLSLIVSIILDKCINPPFLDTYISLLFYGLNGTSVL